MSSRVYTRRNGRAARLRPPARPARCTPRSAAPPAPATAPSCAASAYAKAPAPACAPSSTRTAATSAPRARRPPPETAPAQPPPASTPRTGAPLPTRQGKSQDHPPMIRAPLRSLLRVGFSLKSLHPKSLRPTPLRLERIALLVPRDSSGRLSASGVTRPVRAYARTPGSTRCSALLTGQGS